jgi:hypothetical protein
MRGAVNSEFGFQKAEGGPAPHKAKQGQKGAGEGRRRAGEGR